MKLLVLAIGLTLAAASHIADPEWYRINVPTDRDLSIAEFKPNHEYKFIYEGQLALGIPGSSEQHSASRLQAICKLVFETDRKCILQIQDARFGQLNDRLPTPRRIVPFEAFEHVPAEEHVKNDIRLPVMFKYENGLITEVTFDGEEQPWSANVKRAILNMIQLNLHKIRRVDRPSETDLALEDSVEHDNEFFTVMEPTLEGECETSYTVTGRPSRRVSGKRALNVTKSINFDKCNVRPGFKYNYRFEDFCPTCNKRYSGEERLLKSSTVSEYKVLCNEDKHKCLIDECRVESQYHMVPFGEEGNVITTYVNQLLKLVKTGPKSGEVRKPSNPIQSDSDMLYTLDWDIEKEAFFMQGRETEQMRRYLNKYGMPNKVEYVAKILRKLAHYTRESVEEEAPRQFARLVRMLAFMKPEEISACHERFVVGDVPDGFTPEDIKVIRSLLPDALALCGTQPCVRHIVKDIKNKKIDGFKAVSLVRKMMDIRVVSEEIIDEIWSITETEAVSSNYPLKQSVYFTVGSLLNALCMPNEDKIATEYKARPSSMCPPSLKQKWTQVLVSKMRSAKNPYEKMVCLKALGNAGLDTSIVELEKIIRNVDKVRPPIIRTQAVLSLRQLREVMPHKIIRILMPIIMNKRESTPVRITAVYQLMQCNPEKPILDKLAVLLNRETNKQVASFIYTTMHNKANSTIPCEKRLARDLKLSLRLAKYLPVRSWLTYSKFMQTQWYSHSKNLGTVFDFGTIKTKDSMLPRVMGISLHNLFGGSFKKNVLTFGFKQDGMDQTIRRYLRSFPHSMHSSLSDILSGRKVSPKFRHRDELKSIFESFNINSMEESELSPEVEPFGYLYMRYMDQDYMMMPLPYSRNIPEILRYVVPDSLSQSLLDGDFDSLHSMVKKARKHLTDVEIPLNMQTATYLSRSKRMIPTSMGLPLYMSIKTPAVFKTHGIVKVDFDEAEPLRKVRVQLKNFKPSMVITNVMKLSTWSPVVTNGIKVLSQAKVYMPFSGHLSVDTLKPQPEISFVWEPETTVKQSPVELIRLQTRPMLVSRQWHKHLQNMADPQEFTIHGANWDRVNTFRKETGEHWLGVRFTMRSQWHRTPKHSVPGTPMCPLSGPNKLVISAAPGYEMPKTIRATLTGKLFEVLSEARLSPSSFKTFYQGEKSAEFLRESSEEHSDISAEYINKFESGIPTRHMLRASVETSGSPIKRSAALSTDCQCSERMHTCKCDIKAERTPIPTLESSNWKLECQLETLYPKVPYTLNELNAMRGERFHSIVNAKWGEIGSMNKHFNMKIVGDRSERQLRRLERSIYRRLSEKHRDTYKSLFSPVAQYSSLVKYSAMDEYKININYEVSPYLRNITNKLYRIIKHKFYPEISVNQINHTVHPNELKIKFNVDPVNWRYLNVTVKSPIETCKMIDIALPTRLPVLTMRRRSSPSRSVSDLLENMIYSPSRPVCEVRTDRVRTFESAEYNAPITTCYSVLAKDCSSARTSQFAVLIKKRQPDSEKKTIKIVTPVVKLVVRAVGENELECELNGEKRPCSEIGRVEEHGHTVLKVKKTGPYVQCELPESGIKVYFDGYAANVKVSPIYRNLVCGLCGDYNLSDDEWTTSDLDSGEVKQPRMARLSYHSAESVRDFFKSYLLTGSEQCNVETELVESIRSYERRPLSWTHPIETTYDTDSISLFESESRPCEKFESCPGIWDSLHYERDICDEHPSICDRDLSELSIDSPVRSVKKWHKVTPLRRTRVLERGHDLCFSKTPLPRCPRGTVPAEYETEPIKTAYACLRRNDELAERYQRIAERRERVVEEVERLPSTYAETEVMPKACRYF